MANWAIVIGIDSYWTERACLKGAVRDAMHMQEWLVDPRGGNVPEENVKAVLSPLDGPDDATNANIIEAIADLLRRSEGKGERLYFFYAGHGLTARVNQRDENALVASDFSEVLTNNTLALRSIWEFLETTQFEDQFLFVDACRNIPWENVEFEVGRWPRPRPRQPGQPPTQQFILYATSPGLKARELREAGNERGAFTEALVDGLKGKGTAKAWSEERQRYEVRWERLADYVKKTLDDGRLSVGQGLAQDVFQIPQDAGSRGVAGRERNPVIAEFASDAFDPVKLLVDLKPSEVVSVAEVIVFDEAARRRCDCGPRRHVERPARSGRDRRRDRPGDRGRQRLGNGRSRLAWVLPRTPANAGGRDRRRARRPRRRATQERRARGARTRAERGRPRRLASDRR